MIAEILERTDGLPNGIVAKCIPKFRIQIFYTCVLVLDTVTSYYSMQKRCILHQKTLFNLVNKIDGQNIDFRDRASFGNLFMNRNVKRPCLLKARIRCRTECAMIMIKETSSFKFFKIKSMLDDDSGIFADDEDELCPVDCVKEFKTEEEFSRLIENTKTLNALIVVDFYRTSCGSCKYIEQGFSKLCKGAGSEEAPVIFLKHNVLDEYDEQTEVAERLRIRSVPLFHFYKNGILLEAFPTRDKERILEAIRRYTASASPPIQSIS